MPIKWVDYSCSLIDPISEPVLINHIETAYRVCYNSQEKMRGESFTDSVKFIQQKIKAGHHTPLEHTIFTMRSVMDRGVMAELTRHRIGCAFSIESTRYCTYKNDIECIMPRTLLNDNDSISTKHFIRSVEDSCHNYQQLLKEGIAPQIARGVLPMCLKTEVIHSHNLRELLHILNLRYFGTTGKPHPDMQYWAGLMFKELCSYYPNIFNIEIQSK